MIWFVIGALYAGFIIGWGMCALFTVAKRADRYVERRQDNIQDTIQVIVQDKK